MSKKSHKLVFIDAHAHVDNVKAYLENIRRAEIEVWINTIELNEIDEIVGVSKFISSKIFIGVHPSRADRYESNELLRRIKSVKKVDGLGEIGLDKKYGIPLDVQLKALRDQLAIAERYHLPVVLHTRGSVKEVLNEISSYSLKSVLFHWFSGSTSELNEVLSRGYYVSIGPSIIYSKSSRKVLEAYHQDRLLLETDSPVYYQPLKVEANPTLIVSVYYALSNLMKEDINVVAENIFKVARSFLKR